MWKNYCINLILIISIFPAVLWGRLCEVSTRDNFWVQINRSPIAIIQLYCFDKRNKNLEQKDDYIFLRNRLKAISQNNRLTYASLDFINVNCASCPSLASELSIAKSGLPVILVSINGVPCAQKMSGYANEAEIVQFVERTIGSQIDGLVNSHCQHDQKVEDAQLAAYANCWCSPCNYWCGPWASWGCNPCCRSWNWCW